MIKSVNNQDFKIIAVSNRKLCNRPFLEQIERVCKIHPEAVILREKDLTEEEYGTLAKEVMNICSRYQVSCILHNFWKTALELGCTSVHLPLPILQKITDEEKKIACELAVKAGTDYVKTSTGFGTGGSTPADIKLMRETVGENIGVKASGGVRCEEDAVKVIDAGATRIGASASIAIVSGDNSSKSDY